MINIQTITLQKKLNKTKTNDFNLEMQGQYKRISGYMENHLLLKYWAPTNTGIIWQHTELNGCNGEKQIFVHT